MLRTTARSLVIGAALVATVALAACSGGGRRNAADEPGGRPAAIPPAAAAVTSDTELGHEAPPPDTDPGDIHLLFAMSCATDILRIATTRETVYAELPCDRALPADVANRFGGTPVRLRFAGSTPAKLYIDSKTAGSVEFTVGRVRIESR